MFSLQGKGFVVIGASSGIGAQTAVTLSRQGARVALVARRQERLERVMGELSSEGHRYYIRDISRIDGIEALFKDIVTDFGKLDGMVYSAGISGDFPLRHLSYERLEKVFVTNYFAFIECCRQVCRRECYSREKGLRIVAVSSAASLMGEKAHSAYAGSKAAMDASIRCMAKEMASKGVCINSVAPSMIRTDMYEELISVNGGDNPAMLKSIERQYLGLGEASDVANAICFLLSPEARFITGVTLPVDGGSTSS